MLSNSSHFLDAASDKGTRYLRTVLPMLRFPKRTHRMKRPLSYNRLIMKWRWELQEFIASGNRYEDLRNDGFPPGNMLGAIQGRGQRTTKTSASAPSFLVFSSQLDQGLTSAPALSKAHNREHARHRRRQRSPLRFACRLSRFHQHQPPTFRQSHNERPYRRGRPRMKPADVPPIPGYKKVHLRHHFRHHGVKVAESLSQVWSVN